MMVLDGFAPPAHYDVFGRKLAVSTSSCALAERIACTWRPFLRAPDGAFDPHASMSISNVSGVSPLREWQFFNNSHVLFIGDDRRLVTGCFYEHPWQVDIQAFGWNDDDAYYYVVEPLLLMILMRLGLTPWHSAAVCRAGAAVLIAGPSGSGKSTTALTLLHAGFTFLADDNVFLERSADRVSAISVDAELYATDDTISMFPALRHLAETPLVRRGHGLKRRVPVHELFAADPSKSTRSIVRVVLFPRVRPNEATAIRQLSNSEGLQRLLALQPKESPTLVTDPVALQHHLDTHADLARTASCLDVILGKDAALLPSRIEDFLA